MARRKNNPQQQRSQQFNRERSMVIGTAKRYAHALLNGEDEKLNEMTLYTEGAIGSKGSNVTALRDAGASRLKSIAHNGKTAYALFTNGVGDPACIAMFNVVDGQHVMGDWQVFRKI